MLSNGRVMLMGRCLAPQVVYRTSSSSSGISNAVKASSSGSAKSVRRGVSSSVASSAANALRVPDAIAAAATGSNGYGRVRADCTTTKYKYDLQRKAYAHLDPTDIQAFEDIVGADNVLQEDLDAFNVDWLHNYRGSSSCVLRPANAEECSAILKHCYHRTLAVCPQGGNTSLVGGSVPVFDEVIISTSRMNQDIHIDPSTGILTCSAGCVLETLDAAAAQHGLMMPFDLAARGSCQIGGNVATGAGGITLQRHGSLHAHLLALQAVSIDVCTNDPQLHQRLPIEYMAYVLADGTVLDCGSPLRKDNTGLHVPHLFVGSEGTLGIITQVTISLVPRPTAYNLAFFALDSYASCLRLLELARRHCGEVLNSVEFMDAETSNLVESNAGVANPLRDTDAPFYVLVETAGSNNTHDAEKMAGLVEAATADEVCRDGLLAQSQTQRDHIWALRERVADAMRQDGYVYSQDLTLRQQDFYSVVDAARAHLADLPTKRVFGFGHLADGNCHLVATADSFDPAIESHLYPWLYEWVSSRGGSISSEHGVGFAKRMYTPLAHSTDALRLMQQLKQNMDPTGILNPYKLIPPRKWFY